MTQPTQAIFDRVLLRPSDRDVPGRALLTWQATGQGERLVQVYVNDRLYDVTTAPAQRRMWLHLDRQTDVRIELLAVPPAAAWVDHGGELRSWIPRFVTAAVLVMTRDERLPIDSRAIVTVDGQAEPAIALWAAGDSRAGFGALHGMGEFGRDRATAPGEGLGEFGAAPHGGDGSAWRWRREDLPAGEHELAVQVTDGTGAIVGQLDAPLTVDIDRPPDPPRNVRIDEWFTLTWDV